MSSAHTAIMDVTAVPHDDRSFLVQWTAEVTLGLTNYVVEWKPLLNLDLSHVRFEIVNKNQSSLIITGMSIRICFTSFHKPCRNCTFISHYMNSNSHF